MWSVWLVFCVCGFHSLCPLMNKYKRLMELPDGRDWLWGKLGLVLMSWAMLSKSLFQFSVDGQGCVPTLLHGLRSNCWAMPPLETPGHSQASLAQSLMETLLFCSFLLVPGVHKVLFVSSKSLFPYSYGNSVIKSHWLAKSNSLGVLICLVAVWWD